MPSNQANVSSNALRPPPHPAIKRENIWKCAIIIGLILFGLAILIAIDNMLISFLFAFVISYLSEPLISYFERRGVHRIWCISLYFVFSSLLLVVLIAWLSPLIVEQASNLQSEIPKYTEGIAQFVAVLENQILDSLSSVYAFHISSNIEVFVQRWMETFIESVPTFAQSLLTTFLLAPFFAFFLLKDGHALRKQFLAIVPNFLFEVVLNLTHNINTHIGGFIRARLLEALIVGAVVWVGLTIIDFPYAVFLAFFAGLTNLIPYIGPIIGAIPAYMIALINTDVGLIILLVTSVYTIAQLIDVFFIIPFVVARMVDLHPITVVVVIIIGSQMMGILGMIISIPVTKSVKLTITTIYQHLVEFKAAY